MADGAYESMLATVRSATRPNLLLLRYSSDFQVRQLIVVPGRFLVEEARGWLAVTMGLVRRLRKDQFSLDDLYAFELEAKAAFPRNAHVKAKLRQQLQRLRDLGWLEFEARGKYRLAS